MQAFLPYIMVYTMKHESPMTLKHWLIWQCAARNDAAAIEAFEQEIPDGMYINLKQTADFNEAIEEAEEMYRS